MSQAARRKLLSGFVVGLCALSVVAALIPRGGVGVAENETVRDSVNADLVTKVILWCGNGCLKRTRREQQHVA